MVRAAFVQDLVRRIASQGFDEHDFTFDSSEDEYGHALVITYRYEPEYRLTAHFTPPRDVVTGGMAPGRVTSSEPFEVKNASEFGYLVGEWAKRVGEELRAAPFARELQEQRRRIDELLAEFDDLPDEYFTREEAEDLRARLQQLEQQLAEHISASAAFDKNVDERLEELHEEFDDLRTNVDRLRKKGWLASFAKRVYRWGKDPANRALLKDGVEVTRKLLE